MTVYQKKPDTIEAVQWEAANPQPMEDFLTEKGITHNITNGNLYITNPMNSTLVIDGTYVANSRIERYFFMDANELAEFYEPII